MRTCLLVGAFMYVPLYLVARDSVGKDCSMSQGTRLPTRRQVHVWLSKRDYDWIKAEAEELEESLSGLLRRLVRASRLQQGGALRSAELPLASRLSPEGRKPHT